MIILNPGYSVTVTLASLESLTVNASGSVLVEAVSGLGLATGVIATARGARTFGPYPAGVIRLTASGGDCSYGVTPAVSYDAANVAITGGTVQLNDGTLAAPSFAWSTETGTGFFKSGANQIGASIAGTQIFRFTVNDFRVESNNAAVYFGSGGDAIFRRDAANTLAQRNGVAAQKTSTYNTYTDAANYERGGIDFQTTPNVMRVRSEALGTGVLRPIAIDAFAKAGAAVAADIPVSTFAVVRDTVGLTTKLIYNNAGVLMSVALV